MKYSLLIIMFFGMSFSLYSQDNVWFFIRAKDSLFTPQFILEGENLVYQGNDIKLKSILENYTITRFIKTFKKAKKENLKKTFFVISDKEELLEELLQNTPHLFESGEIIEEEDKKIFEPNDYGLTSTIGDNIGLQVNLDYYDFIDLTKAWYYTTGSPNTIIGISDASVDTTNLDFKGKTKVVKKSSFSKGHGSLVAETAAGQGDNGYGITGVCYDCSINSTVYGDFKNFKQLLELSRSGVRVINCSWVSSAYYDTAQAVIDEMFENGTIIVAAAGNRDWAKTKGKKLMYPASYNHVISVSSVMHRHDTFTDNLSKSKKGNYYAANIKNYVGRTIGFKDNDPLKKHHIWPVSITTLNKEVDILAPSVDMFRFGKFAATGVETYTLEATSSTAPYVSGTIGLMLSLYPCLPTDEIESIIKLTATNIDDIGANKPYAGHYGAGSLNTGSAIKMVYDLYTETETATIENQNFSRWNFKLTAYSKEVVIKNQKFTEAATFNLTAKNRIIIGENTILKPNSEGQIILKIDPTLEKECELQLREGFPNNKYYHPEFPKN